MVQMTFARFFREQWGQIPLVTGDLSTRSLILTGASGGLGLNAAAHLAAMRPPSYRLWLTYKNLANCPPTFHALQNKSLQTVATSLA